MVSSHNRAEMRCRVAGHDAVTSTEVQGKSVSVAIVATRPVMLDNLGRAFCKVAQTERRVFLLWAKRLLLICVSGINPFPDLGLSSV